MIPNPRKGWDGGGGGGKSKRVGDAADGIRCCAGGRDVCDTEGGGGEIVDGRRGGDSVEVRGGAGTNAVDTLSETGKDAVELGREDDVEYSGLDWPTEGEKTGEEAIGGVVPAAKKSSYGSFCVVLMDDSPRAWGAAILGNDAIWEEKGAMGVDIVCEWVKDREDGRRGGERTRAMVAVRGSIGDGTCGRTAEGSPTSSSSPKGSNGSSDEVLLPFARVAGPGPIARLPISTPSSGEFDAKGGGVSPKKLLSESFICSASRFVSAIFPTAPPPS